MLYYYQLYDRIQQISQGSKHETKEQTGNDNVMVNLVLMCVVHYPVANQQIKHEVMHPTGQYGFIGGKHGFHAFKFAESLRIQIAQTGDYIKYINDSHEHGECVNCGISP
jgi:hypothetical protein